MRQTLQILLCLLLLASCKGQNSFIDDRLKTADKFIQCLKDNTPDKIPDYTFPNNIDEKINNERQRDFYVSKANKFIKKFGFPPRDKWLIKFDPQNALDRLLITIPLFEGYDSTSHLLKADLVIAFPPRQISDKIYKWDIADKYELQPLIPPPYADTTKH